MFCNGFSWVVVFFIVLDVLFALAVIYTAFSTKRFKMFWLLVVPIVMVLLILSLVVKEDVHSVSYDYVESFIYNDEDNELLFTCKFPNSSDSDKVKLSTFVGVETNYEVSRKGYSYVDIEYKMKFLPIDYDSRALVTKFTLYKHDGSTLSDGSSVEKSEHAFLVSEYDYLSYLVNKGYRLSEEDFNRVKAYNIKVKNYPDLKAIAL